MDPVLLEVRQQSAEIAELREIIEHLARRNLEKEDRRAAIALFPLAAGLVQSRDFTARSLLAVAFDARTPEGQAIRELAKDISGDGDPDENARALGRMLKRVSGVTLGGYRLEPRGEASEGLRWRLVRVSRAENP